MGHYLVFSFVTAGAGMFRVSKTSNELAPHSGAGAVLTFSFTSHLNMVG
jgi:hypothetical protein